MCTPPRAKTFLCVWRFSPPSPERGARSHLPLFLGALHTAPGAAAVCAMAPPKAEALLLKPGGSGAQLLQALQAVTGAARVALVSKAKNVEALVAWLDKVCGYLRRPRGGARPGRGDPGPDPTARCTGKRTPDAPPVAGPGRPCVCGLRRREKRGRGPRGWRAPGLPAFLTAC